MKSLDLELQYNIMISNQLVSLNTKYFDQSSVTSRLFSHIKLQNFVPYKNKQLTQCSLLQTIDTCAPLKNKYKNNHKYLLTQTREKIPQIQIAKFVVRSLALSIKKEN